MPNATMPNATMPNATNTPNATMPNVTMPNATMLAGVQVKADGFQERAGPVLVVDFATFVSLFMQVSAVDASLPISSVCLCLL